MEELARSGIPVGIGIAPNAGLTTELLLTAERNECEDVISLLRMCIRLYIWPEANYLESCLLENLSLDRFIDIFI